MTLEQVQNDLRVSLEHFVGLGNVLKGSYSSLYATEKGVMNYGLLVAGRRLATMVKEVEKWQKRFILNVTGLDLVKTRGDLLGVMEYLKRCDCDVEISMPREDDEPLFDSERIVERENYRLEFPAKEGGNEYVKARQLMIKESQSHFEELDGIVNDIDNRIGNLLVDEKEVRHNKELKCERLREMRDYYRETQWKQSLELLMNRVRGELKDKENKGKTKIEIVQSVLKDIQLSNTIGCRKGELAYINQYRYDDNRLASAIVAKRDKLTVDDLMEHFDFTESERWLSEFIGIEELREPCEEYDGKLFVNRAALEFTSLIKPYIKQKVDFTRKINIALFFAALRDQGLVYADERNATLMAQYIKEVYEEEVSSSSIHKTIQKCLGKSFCSFDDSNHGNFTDSEFAKYKEVYLICQTVITEGLLIGDVPYSDCFDVSYPGIRHEEILNSLDKEKQDTLIFAVCVFDGVGSKI